MTPPALQALYDNLLPEVIQICEGARRAMRNAYVEGLCTVRDALAEQGLFKDWCRAACINYRTAQTVVARADSAKRQAVADKQPGGTSMMFPTVATQPITTVKKPAKIPVDNLIRKFELIWPDE